MLPLVWNMQFQLTFHDISPSESIASYVGDKTTKLSGLYDRLMTCRVAVEAPHRHHRQGRMYRVRVDMVVPGAELIAGSIPEADTSHQDVYAAIDDAFDDAERVLLDHARRRRGETKPHDPSYRAAEVTKLFADEGYGFLSTVDGDEVYFHKNSVLNHGFGRLHVGSRVRFVQEDGEKGPQASTVAVRT